MFPLQNLSIITNFFFSWLNQNTHIWFILHWITVSNDATNNRTCSKCSLSLTEISGFIERACTKGVFQLFFVCLVFLGGWGLSGGDMPLKVLQTPPAEGKKKEKTTFTTWKTIFMLLVQKRGQDLHSYNRGLKKKSLKKWIYPIKRKECKIHRN